MALDGIFLNYLIKETALCGTGCRVDKIYQPAKDEFVLQLRKKDFTGKLLISANTVTARMHFTSSAPENPAVPPMLCMLMRKKLVGAKLTGIRQDGLERVCFLDFETTDDFGDACKMSVVLEIMGRCSNIILCSGDMHVIDSVRRTDASSNVRVLMPGARYTMPPKQNKLDILLDSPDGIDKLLKGHSGLPLSKALQECLQGFCPAVCRELAFLCAKDDPVIDEADSGIFDALRLKLYEIRGNILSGKCNPTLVKDKNGKTADFSYMPLTQYGDGFTVTMYRTLSELLDAHYAKRDCFCALNARKQELSRMLNNTVSRIRRRTDAQTRELAETSGCEQKRIFGELIKANLHLIEKGSSFCRVPNYYDPDCTEVSIPLKSELSPAANAQRYFKEYRKACTAKQLLSGFISEGERELLYLRSVLDELSRAKDAGEIAEIRAELEQSGYISQKSGKKKAPHVKSGQPTRYISSDGFLIMSGKNNTQNDMLTLKTASKNDIWFHIKNSAGSHVIVFCDGKTVPDSTLTEAAIIAAVNSSAGDGKAAVEIDYCEVKKVRKPAGAAPGMVIYDNYKTAYVKPDDELVKNLMEKP